MSPRIIESWRRKKVSRPLLIFSLSLSFSFFLSLKLGEPKVKPPKFPKRESVDIHAERPQERRREKERSE